MPVTKKDINKLLQHFLDDSWIEPEEADEIREYLHGLLDKNKLDCISLETCVDEDYRICAPSTLWEIIENNRKNDD